MANGYQIPLRSKLLVLTAVMASLLEIIDTSIVNVAVPTMMGNLGATIDEISWVITGYIIANAIVLPIASWMSEQLGRKFYYTGCIILFTASSFACGLAPNLNILVLFRIIQGFAGGALLPTSQALIYEAFPKEQAGMASAIYGMSVMIGPTVGPTLGGYLTDNFGWRSIFNINVPLGIAVMVLSYLFVEDVVEEPTLGGESGAELVLAGQSQEAPGKAPVKKRERQPVDSLGLFLLVLGVGSMQYVLERGHADDWFSSQSIVICSILAVVGIVGLIWWELRTKHPILEFRHFKNGTFRSGMLLMAGLGAMLYSLLFLVPIFATAIVNLTATEVGMLFIPGALASAAAMPFIGRALETKDARYLILMGVIGLSGAMYMMARFTPMTGIEELFWPLLWRGLAMSFLFVPINTVVLVEFTGAAIGEAAGMLNLCRQLGGSIGIAILETLFEDQQVRSFSDLASHVSALRLPALHVQKSLEQAMHGKLWLTKGMGTPLLQATKILSFQAHRQAFVLAFDRTLFTAVVLFSLVLIPLFMMKKPTKHGAVAAAH